MLFEWPEKHLKYSIIEVIDLFQYILEYDTLCQFVHTICLLLSLNK